MNESYYVKDGIIRCVEIDDYGNCKFFTCDIIWDLMGATGQKDKDFFKYKQYDTLEECQHEYILDLMGARGLDKFFVWYYDEIIEIWSCSDNQYLKYKRYSADTSEPIDSRSDWVKITINFVYESSSDGRAYKTLQECKNAFLLSKL
jgi:hypothetical protein